VPGIVDEMSGLAVSGVPYYRYEGQTKHQDPYRATYFSTPSASAKATVLTPELARVTWHNDAVLRARA
jgi:hypothetical protein